MKKTILLIPFVAFFLAIPVACAGSYIMDISGSGDLGFYFTSSDSSGTIMQGYSGTGNVDYKSTYTDGTLESKIKTEGTGGFGTILFPSNEWSADATYNDDGTTVYDTGSGSYPHMFLHSWSSSFNGAGTYTIN